MSDWRRVTVAAVSVPKGLVGGPFGSSLGSKDYVADGVPVIRGSNLGSLGTFDARDFVYVTPEKADGQLARNQARPGDVVFTQRGTLGQVGIVPAEPHERYVISQSQMRLRVNTSVTSPEFVYYQFRSPEMVRRIHSRAIATGVPHINLGILSSLIFELPPMEVQRKIVAALGALDDKIAVNGRIAHTADELSGDLYRYAMLAHPDRFTELALSGTAEFINGRAFTKGATGTGRMVVRIADINSGPGSSTVYNDIEVPEKHLARPGDVLFAWSGSLTVTRWFRPEAIINQHIFKCVPKNGYPHWLVSQLVHRKIDGFRAIAADKATTMGHIQRRHLDEPVWVPAAEELASLDSQIGPLWDRALLAERESLSLATLRDTLLPQLMSGRLRVKDAEKIVEDAT
jgi:type I restriction enzyme S subunit